MNSKACFRFLGPLFAALLCLLPAYGDVVISEFLADNKGGLHDSDDDSPSWIELYNNSDSPVNLGGWRLTDSSLNLARWTFPATNLPPGGYLLVFASGKDRTLSGRQLHANFELDKAGQFLALVRPDGTIAHAYSNYPAQRPNASYGIQTRFPLISPGSQVRYRVPPNGNLGATWTARTFSDAAWALATNALGFDQGNPVALSVDFDERGTTPVTQPGFVSFVINSNNGASTVQIEPTTRVYNGISLTFSNTAPDGYDDRVRTTPVNTGSFTTAALLRDHIMSRELVSTGGLDLTFEGLKSDQTYDVTVWSFDTGSGGRRVSNWYANGSLVRSNYTFDGNVLPTSDDDYQFSFEADSTPGGALVVSGRRDLITQVNNPAVQINAIRVAQAGYRQQIISDVGADMFGRTSIYIRQPFSVINAASLKALVLKVRYDDGFVAYINGQVIATRNAPAAPAHNSTATATHLGKHAEEIYIPLPPGLLVNGANILAMHGLNVAANDNDFFLEASLDGESLTDFPVSYHWPPTPGMVNGYGYQGFVANTRFSLNRGFYDAPIQVSIACDTPGAAIYWTTNGSAPSSTNGAIFTSPIHVGSTLAIRAAAFEPTLIPTEVETHSYIFLQQVLNQPNTVPGYPSTWQANYPADYGMDPNVVNHPVYGATLLNDLRSLPTLSVVMDHTDLWGATAGIYNHGTSSGPDWERPASVELIHPNGKTEFAVNCGVEVHGNASRDNVRTPKHSLRLSFKSRYGPTRLDYNWFDNRVREFDTLVLRALGFGDAWPTRYSDTTTVNSDLGSVLGSRYRPENATYLKDAWIKLSFLEMGHLAPRSDFAHLYLNGLYWGLINPSERINAAFVASHLGGREIDWDVMAGDEDYNVAELRDGFRADWDALIAQVNQGVTTEAAYQSVLEKIDVVNLIDYMLLHGVAEMEDWPHHNWYSAHRRATNGVPDTQWIFIPWDQEIGMDRYVRRDRITADANNTPARIYNKLRAYSEFRRLYGDRVQQHMFNGGMLTTSNCINRFERLSARIYQALVPESARWGDAREFPTPSNPATGITFTRDEWWVPEMQQLYTNYFGDLHDRYITRFQSLGLYPLTAAPEFSQFGGAVPAGFILSLSHPNPGGSIYYTLDGTDPRQYGTAAIAPSAQAYAGPFPINAATVVSARVLNGSEWSALVQASFYPPQDLSKLMLTEIMYNPLGLGSLSGEEFEFLELKNFGTHALNLSGLSFNQGIAFTFTNNTILPPGAFFLLVRNPAAFSLRYPGVIPDGVFTGKLDNAGEVVALSHPTTATVLSIKWGDTMPWPVTADGFGFSLVPRNPGLSQAPDDGAQWRASCNPGGSPGADDPEPNVAPVVINEVLAHTDLPQLDAVELHNPTATNVAIGGWYLTDDPGTPFKFRIPDQVIPPGGLVAFDADDFNAFPGTPTNFLLSSTGDEIYLFAADGGQLTGYSHGLEFGPSFNGVSFGRVINEVGEEFFAPQISVTMGQPNSGPRVGPVVFNEVHYHPEAGGFEFIELLNLTGNPVPLFDPNHVTNTWQINGVGLGFPPGVILAPHALLVLAGTDPATFAAHYDVPASITVLGPFAGALQNDGENLQLLQPDAPNATGVPYVAIEELRYNDRAPWPAGADGSGLSLQRRNPAAFANSPANWQAAAPTPGTLFGSADTDNDGLPDLWENAHGTNPLVADADQDPDNDGMTNAQEYIAGTHPNLAESALRLSGRLESPTTIALEFLAVSNRTYSVLFREAAGQTWLPLSAAEAHPTNRLVQVLETLPPTARFYRLVTPALP